MIINEIKFSGRAGDRMPDLVKNAMDQFTPEAGLAAARAGNGMNCQRADNFTIPSHPIP
jgi:hypothetical protein